MATKKERELTAIIVLLSVLLVAALGGCGYYYSQIAGFESNKKEALAQLDRDHKLAIGVLESNLEKTSAKLETANKKIEKFNEKEAVLLKRIDDIKEKYQEKLDKKSVNLGSVKQSYVSPSAKKKHTIKATQSKKKVAIATPTIKTVHKAKPVKKIKPSHIKKAGHHKNVGHISKKAGHGKKHAHVSKKAVHAKKHHKQVVKNHHKQPGKIQATAGTMSLTALCEAGGSDVPFFKNLLKDSKTYGYTAQAWEEKDGSVKRVKILLTGPEMPNVQ